MDRPPLDQILRLTILVGSDQCRPRERLQRPVWEYQKAVVLCDPRLGGFDQNVIEPGGAGEEHLARFAARETSPIQEITEGLYSFAKSLVGFAECEDGQARSPCSRRLDHEEKRVCPTNRVGEQQGAGVQLRTRTREIEGLGISEGPILW